MRDYNKIADRVFRRRDEYLAEKKRKRAIYIKSASVALSCCIMIMLGIGIWKTDLLSRIAPKDDDFRIPEAVTTTSAATTVETIAETTSALTAAYADTTTTAAVTSKDSGISAATAASSATASTVSTAHTTAPRTPSGTSAPSRTTASGTEMTSPARTTQTYERESEEPSPPNSRATSSSTRRTTVTTIRTTTKTTSATTRPIITTSKHLSTMPASQSTTSVTKEAVRTSAAMTTAFVISGSTAATINTMPPVATMPAGSTTAGSGDIPVAPVNPTVPAAFTHSDTYYELTGETADFNRVSELIDSFYAESNTGETIYVYLFVYDGYSPDEICAVHIDSVNDYYLCTPSEYPPDTPKPSPKRPPKEYAAASGHLTMPDKKQTFQTTKTQPTKLTQ